MDNRRLAGMAALYAVFWVAMAINPVYPYDWWIENILVFVTVGVLVATFRWFRFSDLSYGLIIVFLALHTYSAHYAYTQVPFPWLNTLFGRPDRLNFDRFVHLNFGLLLTYPVWEVLRRSAGLRGAWSYFMAVVTILAAGAFYELLEMWIAKIVAPDLADAFVGTQGDIWDPQMDIALAMYGAMVVMALTWATAGRRRESWLPDRLGPQAGSPAPRPRT